MMLLFHSLRGSFRPIIFTFILAAHPFGDVDVLAQTFTFGTQAPLEWQKVRGNAQDVGISPNGSVYIVSRAGRVWRWGSVLGEEWKTMPGHGFTRIDAGQSNKPWVITDEGQVRYYNGLWWETRGEGFVDIGAGPKGQVFALGVDGDVAKWNAMEKQFDTMSIKRGVRIDVDKDGHPWVVGENGAVFAYDGEAWSEHSGTATDISIGPKGNVFASLANGTLGRWSGVDRLWEPVKGVVDATAVSVGPGGKPWALTDKGKIYATSLFLPEREQQQVQVVKARPAARAKSRQASVDPATLTDPSPIKFTKVPGPARDIAIGADGSVFIVRAESVVLGRYSNQRKQFLDFPGDLTRLAVSSDGSPWGVNNKREIFRHDGRDWKRVRGADAVDIAIGGGGEVFVTDTQESLFKLDAASGRFKRYPGVSGTRVAVDSGGSPWVVGTLGEIRRCDVSPCTRLARKGRDIAIGPDGSVFLTNTNGKIFVFNSQNNRWRKISGVKFRAEAIAVGPKGRPWAIDSTGQVYASDFFVRDEKGDTLIARRTVKPTTTAKTSVFTFTKNITFEAAHVSDLGGINIFDLAVGADGTVVGIESTFDGNPPQKVFVYNTRSEKFEEADDQPSVYADTVAVDSDGEIWVVNTTTAEAYEQVGHSFKKRTGLQSGGGGTPDIAIGADGSVFAIDTAGTVFRYDAAARRFKSFDSSRTYSKISVSPLGVPWVTDTSNVLYRYTGQKFERISGFSDTVGDIGIGADGSVYIRTAGTGAMKRWNASNQSFDDLSNGTADRLSVSPEGRPWFIDSGDSTKINKPLK